MKGRTFLFTKQDGCCWVTGGILLKGLGVTLWGSEVDEWLVGGSYVRDMLLLRGLKLRCTSLMTV